MPLPAAPIYPLPGRPVKFKNGKKMKMTKPIHIKPHQYKREIFKWRIAKLEDYKKKRVKKLASAKARSGKA